MSKKIKDEDEVFDIHEFKKEHKNKAKQPKEEKEMKNIKENSTVRTIITVFITLVCIASLAGTFILGMNYGADQQKSINNEVSSQVKDMATAITSKTNQ